MKIWICHKLSLVMLYMCMLGMFQRRGRCHGYWCQRMTACWWCCLMMDARFSSFAHLFFHCVTSLTITRSTGSIVRAVSSLLTSPAMALSSRSAIPWLSSESLHANTSVCYELDLSQFCLQLCGIFLEMTHLSWVRFLIGKFRNHDICRGQGNRKVKTTEVNERQFLARVPYNI